MSDQPEPRFIADLAVRVFGMDAVGRPFSRSAHTLDISDRGARLPDLKQSFSSGTSSECSWATAKPAAG
jgi:hypothetical protein